MNAFNNFQSATWAEMKDRVLTPMKGEQPIQMVKSDATALSLIFDQSGDKPFGASLIRFAAGEKVGLHTHVGSHILVVTYGLGILTYLDTKIDLKAGLIYLIPSNVPHAIDALSELVIIAIGNDFRAEGSKSRLTLVGEDDE
ncbi:MAG: cupin domain-containing protein [Candidatus Nomurabacteria bacterium]|nr:MAG: cupin domain-containing protein [Candidatus Nomurabacteria bacterium]